MGPVGGQARITGGGHQLFFVVEMLLQMIEQMCHVMGEARAGEPAAAAEIRDRAIENVHEHLVLGIDVPVAEQG